MPCYGVLYIMCNIGDVSLSANREQIHIDNKTKLFLKKKLDHVKAQLKEKASAQIDACENLYQANVLVLTQLSKLFDNMNFLSPLKWKNFPISNGSYGSMSVDCKIECFYKESNRQILTIKKKKLYSNAISFEERSALFLNDLDKTTELTAANVRPIFEELTSLHSIQIYSLGDKTNQYLNDKYHFDFMNVRKLSDFCKVKNIAAKAPKTKLVIFKYNLDKFVRTSYDAFQADKTTNKVLCRINSCRFPIINNISYTPSLKCCINENTSIYGIYQEVLQSRIDEDLPGLIDIDIFVKNKFDKNEINFIEIEAAKKQAYNVNTSMLEGKTIFYNGIKDKNSIFLKKLQMHDKIKSLSSVYNNDLWYLYQLFYGDIKPADVSNYIYDHLNLQEIDDKCDETYRLLQHISYYNSCRKTAEGLLEYINLVDKEKNK
jgi:hypothetical protein